MPVKACAPHRWSRAPAAPVQAKAGVSADGRMPRAVWPVGLMAVVLLCLPPLLLDLAAPQASTAPRLQLQQRLTADWRATDQPVTDWTPSIAQASAQAQRSYRSNDMEVGVYIAYYRNQDSKHQLVSSANALVKDQDPYWNLLSRGVASVPAAPLGFEAGSAEIVSASMLGRSRNAGLMVWHWYWVGGVVTRSDLVAKVLGVWQRLTGQGDESAALVLYAQQDETDRGRIALQSFVRDNWSLLDQQLRETSHRK